MQNTVVLVAMLAFAILCIGNAGCSKSATSSQDIVNAATSLPASGTNFRLSLTDAPHPSLSHVIVNVDHIELLLEKEGQQGRLILAQGLGPLDLLKLRDGVHLPIRDLNLKENVVVKQFRLILKSDGNWIQRLADNSICSLKTPSQQQTGLKLIMPGGGIQIDRDQAYSLIVDFDVDHSIVDNKNNCLLKPVLKVKSLLSVPQDGSSGGSSGGSSDNGGSSGGSTGGTTDGSSSGGSTSSGGTTTGDTSSGGSTSGGTSSGGTTGGDTSTGGSTSGADTGSSGSVSSGGTTSTDTGSGSTSTGSDPSTTGGTSSGGSTSSTGSDPSVGSTTSGGGTSSTDSGDGAPIVTEGNTLFFNP